MRYMRTMPTVPNSSSKLFFIVLARNRKNVEEKIMELEEMRVSYVIVCGEMVNHPNVVYREENLKKLATYGRDVEERSWNLR